MGYTYLTREGYAKLKAELEDKKTNGRSEAARAIGEAREKGDLSENAEYDAAKDAQGHLEARINVLDKVMANARIIDESQVDTSKVTILSKVKILNKKFAKEVTYMLVSETEADIKLNKISVTSPIGKGLLGKVIGDTALITTPNGNMEFEVLDISI